MGAGHSHSHDHGLPGGGWEFWLRSPRLRGVLTILVVSFIGAIIGLVLLWPTGEGRIAAIESADAIGLATDRVRAEVLSSSNQTCSFSQPENPVDCRLLNLDILEGPDAGAEIALPEINLQIERGLPEFEPGDTIVLGYAAPTDTYFYEDVERSNVLIVLTVIFVVAVIAFARLRGALALLAMAGTVVVLVGFVAPSVLDGNNPIAVAVVAAIIIAFVSLFLSHGFTPTTAVALAGTIGALGLTLVLSWVFFGLARFTGFADSDALLLPVLNQDLRVSSLLLGGAIIGALGALDDVTVTQVATVAELRRQNPMMAASELVASGIRVGRDHIAATVNTLLLAYAGASLPVLLLFAASDQSLGIVANSEVIAVEIARTLCGSIGLIAAVPLTTGLAATVLPPTQSAQVSETDQTPTWDDFAPDEPQ